MIILLRRLKLKYLKYHNNDYQQNEGISLIRSLFSSDACNFPIRSYVSEQQDDDNIVILGTSVSSALIAAELGLPYAFAAHISIEEVGEATACYIKNFKASKNHENPYLIITLIGCAASTEQKAKENFSTIQWAYFGIDQSEDNPLFPPSTEKFAGKIDAQLQACIDFALLGNEEQVLKKMTSLHKRIGMHEIMIYAPLYYLQDRIDNFLILKKSVDHLTAANF